MNAGYVRRHLKFGKAGLRPNIKYPRAAWHGVPRSAQFTRGYPKPEIGAFRLEAQVNRDGLKRYGINTAADIEKLAEILIAQIGFYRMDWRRLEKYLRRNRGVYAETILRQAKKRRNTLTDLLSFLRIVGVSNPSLFLIAMPINTAIHQALSQWGEQWARDGERVPQNENHDGDHCDNEIKAHAQVQ